METNRVTKLFSFTSFVTHFLRTLKLQFFDLDNNRSIVLNSAKIAITKNKV